MRSVALLLLLGLAVPAAAEGPFHYAWVPVDAFDRNGKPVTDESGKPIHDGFCLLWKTNWLTDNRHLGIADNPVWWTGLSYVVDPRNQRVIVTEVYGPDAVATPKGPKFFSREEIDYPVKVVAPLLNDPKDDWPCTKETWALIKSGAKEWVVQKIMPRSSYTFQRSCSPNCN